jgi:hypothetical protein
LKGPIWEGRLVKFCGLFTQRRGEFEFALNIHTVLGVDAANKTLGDVDKTTREMNEKMELMMRMFQVRCSDTFVQCYASKIPPCSNSPRRSRRIS